MTSRIPHSMPKITRRTVVRVGGAAAAATLLGMPAIAQGRSLTIISNRGNAEQRRALESIAAAFGREAGVQVSLNNMDHEAHKTAIRNYLVASPPDICFWFSGSRMRSFVQRNLFEDISDLVARENYTSVLGPTLDSVTVDGRQYGLPTGGILWGFFYRQDVFDEHGFTAPRTFDDLVSLGEAAKTKGLVPISIGTKDAWPAGGWFDHMNLRINGLQHHMDLMAGKIPYTDGSLKEVFDRWEQLIAAGMFTPNATSYAWEPAAAAVVQKRAAMMDLGNFIKEAFPPEDLPQVRFAPFPEIKAGLDRYEDFSLDSVHIPSGGANKDVAKEFLAYFYRPDNLAAYLDPEGNVPARTDVAPSTDPIRRMAREALQGVKGTAQYYDRDSDPDLAQAGLKGLQEFMVRPERRDRILAEIERTRQRIHG